MVYANEVYQWFKELAAHSRIEFTCNLMKLCVPSESRFISTLLEDMNNKDYPSLRDTEERCNSPSEFTQYTHVQLNSEHVHKLCLCLSLLKPTNQILAQMIYEILRIHFRHVCKCVMLHSDIKDDIMLLYALASYHPAFAFNCRHKLAEYFTTLLGIYNDDGYVNTNCNNSAVKETLLDRCHISVSDVIMDKTDAIIVVETVSKKCVSQRQCRYSEIRKTICTIFSDEHEFYRTIVTLSTNGSFTTKNIRDIINKILIFAYSESTKNEAKQISDFFYQLPLAKCFQTSNAEGDCKDIIPDCCPVFHSSCEDIIGDCSDSDASPINDCDPVRSLSRGSSSTGGALSAPPDLTSSHTHTQLASISHHRDLESDPAYMYPLNMLSLPYNPLIRYYLPNYSFYVQSKCTTSSPTCVLSSIASIDSAPANTDANTTISHHSMLNGSCLPTTTFIPYGLQQSPFTPVHLLCHSSLNPCFQSNEPYTSILSSTTPSFALSNVVIRPQPTTNPPPLHTRQKSTHHNITDSAT